MAKTQTFEVFINTHTSRVAIIEAANIYGAYDRAVELCPGVDWRRIIVVPTTFEAALLGSSR